MELSAAASDPMGGRPRLIGRDQLVREIETRLGRDSGRLLTLTGPGGVGKTRLAEEILGRDDACFVPLAAARSLADAWPAVAGALPVPPEFGGTLESAVRQTLKQQPRLLVLDNLEQLAGAGRFATDLLSAGPDVRILATSRRLLGIDEERELSVPPLLVPRASTRTAREAGEAPAVALFVERVRRSNPAFELTDANAAAIGGICRLLDGLPLALELAAARARFMDPETLLKRLDKALDLLAVDDERLDARQRTIRNTIAWSYDLLSAEEQRVFRHLGLFRNGCTLDAIEALMTGRVDADTLAIIESLDRHGLLVPASNENGEPRITMLETVRAFAVEQLDQAGEAEPARAALAHYVAGWAADAGPRLESESVTQLLWWNRIYPELANIRQVLDWHQQRGDYVSALQCIADLNWFWSEHTLVQEGLARLEPLLEMTETSSPAGLRARAYNLVSGLHGIRGNAAPALVAGERALEILRTDGTPRDTAIALYHLAAAANDAGDLERMGTFLHEALPIFVALGDGWFEAATRVLLGTYVRDARGDFDEALSLFESAVAKFRAIGERSRINGAICAVGLLHLQRGNFAEAQKAYRAALDIEESAVSDRVYLHDIAIGFAAFATESGNDPLAVRLISAGQTSSKRTGTPPRRGTLMFQAALLDRIKQRIGEPAYAVAWLAGHHLDEERIFAFCRSVPDVLSPPAGLPPELARLSGREREVLKLLAAGQSDAEIADRLSISRRTASQHVSSILGKLDVSSRTAAAAMAAKYGFVER